MSTADFASQPRGPLGPRSNAPVPRAAIAVKAIKIAIPLAPDALPKGLVPAEGPVPPDVYLDLRLEGSRIEVPCRIAGKSYRRALKAIEAQPAENLVVLLQGALVPASGGGTGLIIKDAGLVAQLKTPKPEAKQP